MKFTIVIQQKRFRQLCPTLDLKDAALIAWIMDFIGAPKVETIVYHAKTYYWIAHALIFREMPLLDLNNADAIYRRMRKLIDAGLLEAHPENKKLRRSYYRITDLAARLASSDEIPMTPDQDPKGIGSPSEGTPDAHPEDQTIKDQTIRDHGTLPLFDRSQVSEDDGPRRIGERPGGNQPRS